jgi:hypothetical protein
MRSGNTSLQRLAEWRIKAGLFIVFNSPRVISIRYESFVDKIYKYNPKERTRE